MKSPVLVLSKQQVIWLKDLIRVDIHEWQEMAARPVDEVGARFSHLAQVRVDTMQSVLAKLDAVEAIDTLRKIDRRYSGLVPEVMVNFNEILAVVFHD